ncbi:hypothetical protein LJC59_06490 [Desulfovibrio sp. OttesenSCG-928-A18]|nr:hypothetical protein [Desulfovibrio sp. OttesenSCG-928-A18]
MLLLHTLQQFDIELPYFFLFLGVVGVLLFFVLAALCSPLLALKTEFLYAVRRKPFYDKCAMQLGQSSLFLLVFAGISITAAATGFFLYQAELAPFFPVPPVAMELRPLVTAVPMGGLFLLMLLYYLLWRPLKKLRALHLFFGLLPVLGALLVLFCGFLVVASARQPLLFAFMWMDPLNVLHLLILDFLGSHALWYALGCLYCTGMAAAGGLAQLWLIFRRNRADYGRDYYAFAMRYCARFALAFVVFSGILAALFFWELKTSVPAELSQGEDPGVLLLSFCMPLLCALLWFFAAKSDTPMRHKPGAIFACLFLFVALCGQMVMLVNTFPSM